MATIEKTRTGIPEMDETLLFPDISKFSVIVEISYVLEFSYSSHIFPTFCGDRHSFTAIFEWESTIVFATELLKRFEDISTERTLLADDVKDVFLVYEPKDGALILYYDMNEGHLLIVGREGRLL